MQYIDIALQLGIATLRQVHPVSLTIRTFTPVHHPKPSAYMQVGRQQVPASQIPGSTDDEERQRRREEKWADYRIFLREAELRHYKFEDHKTRAKIWGEQREDAENRIIAIEQEKLALEAKMETMRVAEADYVAKRGPANDTSVEDKKIRDAYEEYFDLKTDELFVN